MTSRPDMPHPYGELYDLFLTPNGIRGWMPERPTVVVAGGTITAPIWRHRGHDTPWGPDVLIKSDFDHTVYGTPDDGPVTDQLTAPLIVPVTDRVRELAREAGLQLIER
jgi:hypothetical protein